MKLTYWVAECLNDNACYNIRTRTRKECLAQVAEAGNGYGAPRKVTVEYADGFDLVTMALSEGRGWWEVAS